MTTFEIHPDYRASLEAAGLATFDALFAAGERARVDGHATRSVSRLEIPGADGRPVVVYLKRQWGDHAAPSWRDLVRLRQPMPAAEREWRAAMDLVRSGVPVAAPVAWGQDDAAPGPRALIAFRGVDGPSLAAWLDAAASGREAADAPRRRAVAEAVGRAVRELHDAGFSLPDLYAKHLFLEDLETGRPRVVLIDVIRLRGFTSARARADLAALYASVQGGGAGALDFSALLTTYLGAAVSDAAVERLRRAVERAAARIPGRGRDPHLLAALRTAPPGVVPLAEEKMVEVDGGRLTINEALRPALEAAGLTTLDALMAVRGGEIYRDKQGEGRKTVRLELPDPAGGTRAVFLKRYTEVPWRTKLRRMLSLNPPESTARGEWRGIARLAAIGLASMRPVAIGEELLDRGRRERSCVVTEEIAGATQADDYAEANFAGPPAPDKQAAKEQLIRAIAGLARRLHAARLSHRDFYLCHILVRPMAGAAPVLHLIDLQRLTFHRRGLSTRWIVKDLAALLFSSWPSPATGIRSAVFTDEDRMLFAREYFGTPDPARTHRWLLARVHLKARRIAWKERGRRARKGDGA